MITFQHSNIGNLENAMRGARNPMNSWGRSDSSMQEGQYVLGSNDLDLAQRLCRAGSDHRKFLRQIFISIDISAPLYWWKEFDTYKVGTTANSTSTMHKIHSSAFTEADFSVEHMTQEAHKAFAQYIAVLEDLRVQYNTRKDKALWYSMIQMLPSSYHQLRTVTMTYENARSMYHARKHHKLEEWHTFCAMLETLPYAKELLGIDNTKA